MPSTVCASVAVSSAASSSAATVTVTVCAVSQLAVVNSSAPVPFGSVLTSALFVVSAIPTVTAPPGSVFSRTEYVAVPGSSTASAVVLTVSPGTSLSVTVTATAATASPA